MSERDLIAYLARELADGITTSGHVALTNEREGRGYCSWRQHSPICMRRWVLLDAAADYLEATEPERQVEMLDEAVG